MKNLTPAEAKYISIALGRIATDKYGENPNCVIEFSPIVNELWKECVNSIGRMAYTHYTDGVFYKENQND